MENELRNEQERRLDADELAELLRIARHARIKPVWIAVPLTLWFWPMFFASVAARRFPTDLFMIFSLFLLGSVTIYWEWQVFAGRALSRKLREDAAAGYVLTSGNFDREVLPVSEMEWTAAGVASPWRGHAPQIAESDSPNS